MRIGEEEESFTVEPVEDPFTREEPIEPPEAPDTVPEREPDKELTPA